MTRPEPAPRTESPAPSPGSVRKGGTGLGRLVRATGHSPAGLRNACRSECAFRQETWLAVPTGMAAFCLGRDGLEVPLLLGTVVLVLIVELPNSAIEAAIDRIGSERHGLSKNAKDFASAAVLLSLLLCAGVWLAALWQRFGA